MSPKLLLCVRVSPEGTYTNIRIVACFNKACSLSFITKHLSLQNVNTMVYVYHRGSLAIQNFAPSVPQTVSKMMEEPRNKVEFVHQKRAWAHAVFFLQQEMELYHAFLQAYRVKM